MNWAAYTREIQGTCNKIIDGLIDVFDSWLTRAVLGQARLKTLVTQLRQMKQLASRQIELVMKDLQVAQRKALATPYPNTTARVPIVARTPAPAPKAPATPVPKPKTPAPAPKATATPAP